MNIWLSAASEEGFDPEEAKQKLKNLVDKFGKENDEDFDFDDLNIEEDFSSEEENGWPENSILYYFGNKKYPQPSSFQLRPGLFTYQIGEVLEPDFYGLLGDLGQA